MTYAEDMARKIVGGDLDDEEALSFVRAIVEHCAREAEKSYRTAVDGMSDLNGEGAAMAARAYAARCIRALATEAQS